MIPIGAVAGGITKVEYYDKGAWVSAVPTVNVGDTVGLKVSAKHTGGAFQNMQLKVYLYDPAGNQIAAEDTGTFINVYPGDTLWVLTTAVTSLEGTYTGYAELWAEPGQ